MTTPNRPKNKQTMRRQRATRRRNPVTMPIVPQIAAAGSTFYGFPPTLLTKLKYVDTYALISTAGSLAKQIMYMNSVFDPDNSGTGHQPLYHDSFSAVYDHYTVVSCKAIVQFQSLAATTAMSIGIVIDDNNTTSTTPTTLMEQNAGKHSLLPPLTGSRSNVTLTHSWDAESYLGVDPYTSQGIKTLFGANPTEIAALCIWSVPADGSSTATVQAQVTLEFTVLCSELSTPTQS